MREIIFCSSENPKRVKELFAILRRKSDHENNLKVSREQEEEIV